MPLVLTTGGPCDECGCSDAAMDEPPGEMLRGVVVDPPAREWAQVIHDRWGGGLDARARRFREEVSLPTDRPIVMAGHHAGFWHAGILAKAFAIDEAARRAGGAGAWVVVDQDEGDPLALRVPVREQGVRLDVRTIRFAPAAPEGAPACVLPAAARVEPARIDGEWAAPGVGEGARRIAESLAHRAGEPNLARQAAKANADLLGAVGLEFGMPFATDLARTTLFSEIVDRFAEDPARAAETYNAAAARFPEAHVAPLRRSAKGAWELPLWRLEPGRPRGRVFADDLASIPRERLAPRALLMTDMLRLAGCELFVHGRGGIAYDRITEVWLREWLGEEIAPMALTTATLLLPLGNSRPSEAEVRRAAWLAHRARHDPAALGRPDAASEKALALEAVRRAPRGSDAARRAYLDMHRRLAAYRDGERERMRALDDRAAMLARLFAEGAVAEDRTWPWPFHTRESIRRLGDAVRAGFK